MAGSLALSSAGLIPRSGSDLQPNVAARRLRWAKAERRGRNPIRGWGGLEFVTQGSRGGNPGLEVGTAARYLFRGSLKSVIGFRMRDHRL